MPVTIPEALARLTPFVLDGLTHPDYARTVQYAADWHDMECGRIDRFLPARANDTPATRAARLAVTIPTVPALIAETRNPFYKVSRLKGAQVQREFKWADAPSEAERARREAVLLGGLDTYHANKPVEDYLSDVVVRQYALSDPNAWLLTTFGPFDFRTQAPKPYPVILPADAVVDFTREAGVTSSVTARVPVSREGVTGYRYTCYLDNQALDVWPVLNTTAGPVSTLPAGAQVAGELVSATGNARWQYRLLAHNAGQVPAKVLGYVPDPETQGRTNVSPLDAVLCFLRKEIRTGSELDIVMDKTVHPHKSQFVPACAGIKDDGGCINGIATQLPGGPGPCRVCHGTGYSPVAESASDVVTFPLPRDMEDLPKLPKLGDMVDFKMPPIEVPRFQVEYLEKLRVRIWQVLFNKDSVQQTAGAPTATATATERLQQAEQLNIALSPLADFIADLYVHIGLVCAGYRDVARALAITYRQPADLLPPSITDLQEVYGAAVLAGMGPEYLEKLYKRIIRQELAESPEELRRLEVQWRFVSYVGVPEAAFMQRAALQYISTESRTLRIEQDRVFYELELARPDFYDLSPAMQQPLVDAKVKELVALLPAVGGSGAFPKMNFNQPVPAVPVTA